MYMHIKTLLTCYLGNNRLNEQKEKRHNEYCKLKEEDEAELKKIAKEIDEENKTKILKVQHSYFILYVDQES